jgi:hypothetical protein
MRNFIGTNRQKLGDLGTNHHHHQSSTFTGNFLSCLIRGSKSPKSEKMLEIRTENIIVLFAPSRQEIVFIFCATRKDIEKNFPEIYLLTYCLKGICFRR